MTNIEFLEEHIAQLKEVLFDDNIQPVLVESVEKELEAIRDDKLRIGLLGLKRLVEANAKKMTKDEIMAFDFTFMNITNALLELQAIKEANPSEALECLEDLRQECKSTYFDENGKQWWTTDKNKDYRCNTIKQALTIKSKKELAFDVCIRKNVNIYALKNRFKKMPNYEYINYTNNYGNYHNGFDVELLTQEEFDLLKEMLK